jgi:2-keto-4-pentenoate hydratase/2-oxohepta-3-ene-1,7-dioic acid hydratase in catechol pathway
VKFANYDGRASVVINDRVIDVERASGGAFGPDVQGAYDAFDDLITAAKGFDASLGEPLDKAKLGSPVPRPRQVFAIGLNYFGHAEEAGLAVPEVPATFTKFPSSLSGPFDPIPCEGPTLDWEVELVVVIGRTARSIHAANAWDVVAGLTVGQDISERTMQFAAGGQFSLGKSYEGFGPVGPWLVTPDEVPDPNDLRLRCWVNDVLVQDDRTTDMVFTVPSLIERLSAITTLWPGDLVFTGTPAGVGITAQPPRFLAVGDVVRSEIDGIGAILNDVIPPQR